MSARVVAVVVTWNRRELLQEALAALRTQTHPPSAIVVVDNASTDGTTELLTREHAGFAAGIERALTLEPDLVWLLDDDTVPTAAAAERLVGAWASYGVGRGRRPAVLASRVVWTDAPVT